MWSPRKVTGTRLDWKSPTLQNVSMKTFRSILLALATGMLPLAHAFGAVLTFDDFPALADEDFGPGNYWRLEVLNDGSHVYGGVTWDPGWYIAGDEFIPYGDASDLFADNPQNTEHFTLAHSGHFTAWSASSIGLDTSLYLTGVWITRPREESGRHLNEGATNITVSALSGTNVLAAVSMAIVDSTPAFMDTSSFLMLRGVTRYRFDVISPFSCECGFFVADDFQFASTSLRELCPCDGSWRSHAEYVRCVYRAVVSLIQEDALTRGQARQLLRDALHSDCGQRR
jgi:hypothetical protein